MYILYDLISIQDGDQECIRFSRNDMVAYILNIAIYYHCSIILML